MKKRLWIGLIFLIAGLAIWPALTLKYIQGIWIVYDYVRILNYLLSFFLISAGLVLMTGSRYPLVAKVYLKGFLVLIYTCVLLFAADRLYGWLKPPYHSGYSEHYSGDKFINEYLLGFSADANSETRAVLSSKDDTIFDVVYHTDKFGRRITLPNNDSSRQYIVFFGGSNTFGWGLNDNETIPSHYSLSCRSCNAYNYSFPGYGPNQMLAKIESNTMRNEIPESTGTAVYVFIPHHINRAIGDMDVFNRLGRSMPYYDYDDQGKIIRKGNFTNRKWLNKIYRILNHSYIAKGLNINFPMTLKAKHLELTADIIAKSRNLYAEQFGNQNFIVVFHPVGKSQRALLNTFRDMLIKRNLMVLDYSDLLGDNLDPFVLNPTVDTHPNSISNEMVARKLSEVTCPH